MGQLDSALDLPDPGATDRQAAYLVGANEPYDLYVIVGLPGHLEWFDSGSFTTAEADISQFEAGTGLTLSEVDSKIVYSVNNTVIPNFQDLSDLAWNINASVANTYATKASLSSFQSDVNSAFSSVYGAIDALSSVYATPAQVSSAISALDYASVGALSSATVIPDVTGLASEQYVDNSISALSSVYQPVGSYVSQADLSGYAILSANNNFEGSNTF